MNPVKQLLRRTVPTLAALLLLCAVSAFLCIGFGTFFSAEATRAALEEQYLTVAYPSLGKHEVKSDVPGRHMQTSDYTSEARKFVQQLEETSPLVKGRYEQRFISAYSPSFSPLSAIRRTAAMPLNWTGLIPKRFLPSLSPKLGKAATPALAPMSS